MKVVRVIFFCLIVFLALPEFVLGVPALMNGIRAHGDVWSVRHDYFGDAAITLIAGLLAVGFAAWGAFWPGRTNWLRFLVATSIVFLMAVSIPSWYAAPEMRSRSAMTGRMRTLQVAVDSWGNDHGRFPLTDAELKEAASAGEVRVGDSPFQRGGVPVQFELALISSAAGPVLHAERPAVLYYAVDADGKRFWISATTLEKSVGNAVVMVGEGSSGPPFVIEGKLEAPAPAAPAPTSKPTSPKPVAKKK